jgi:competence ComEA-like helix-hairpin-helix protein
MKSKFVSAFTFILFIIAIVVGFSGTSLATSEVKKDAKEILDKIPTEPVNINTADLDTLMSLPGIGEKKAQDILSFRKSIGSFKSIEQLMEVPGIGEGIFKQIQKLIKIK